MSPFDHIGYNLNPFARNCTSTAIEILQHTGQIRLIELSKMICLLRPDLVGYANAKDLLESGQFKRLNNRVYSIMYNHKELFTVVYQNNSVFIDITETTERVKNTK